MAAANQEWAEALVAEPEVVSEEAMAAANRAGAMESAVAMVGAVATAAEAVDPVAATALEGVWVAVPRAARYSSSQTHPSLPRSQDRPHRNEWFAAANLGLRVLPTRASERKIQFLRSFPLLKSSGDAPSRTLENVLHPHGVFTEHQQLPPTRLQLRTRA